MRDRQNQDDDPLVFDPANQPVVADAVTPKPGAWSGQGATQTPWILLAGDSVS